MRSEIERKNHAFDFDHFYNRLRVVARTDMMLKMENIFKRDSWTKDVRKTGNVKVKNKQKKYNTKTKNTKTIIL